MKTIYLANPYMFSEQQRELLLPPIIKKLESLGLEVWEPYERNNAGVDFSDPNWAYRIGQADLEDVARADAIFAIVNGCPPEEGTMVELGMAIAHHKRIFLFRDDFRETCRSGLYPLNLMLFTGLPRDSWHDYYYQYVDEITDAERALFKWAKGG
jgi:nucleoside 2-deoxyribosyltransferase